MTWDHDTEKQTRVAEQDGDTFDSLSLTFEELMNMLQRNKHLVPTVKEKCVPRCAKP